MEKNIEILKLSCIFLKKDLRERYASSILGPIWIIIYPLLFSVITIMVFSFFFKNQTHDIPYYIFVLSGFTHWIFFSTSITKIATSLKSHKNIISNIKISIFIIPLSSLLSRIVDFGVGFIMLITISLITNSIHFSPYLFFYPLIIIIQIIFQFGLGLIAVSFSTLYKDTLYLIDVAIQLLFYLSPVVYDLKILPSHIQKILTFNPLTLFFTQYRNVLFGGQISFSAILFLSLLSLLTLTVGIFTIKKYQYVFPEVI